MVRRHVLAALATGVAAGNDDAARAALGRIDWVLRGRARRRLEQVLIDAALATQVMATDDADAARHVMHAAALLVGKQPALDFTDADAVERAYGELETVRAPRFPLASVVAGALVLAISTSVVAAAVMAKHAPPPPGELVRSAPPAPIGAYRDGGVPIADAGVETVLRDELRRVLALRAVYRTPGLEQSEPAGLEPFAAVAAAWSVMVDELVRFDANDGHFKASMHDLRARVQMLGDQLAGAGLGYFVDLELTPQREPVITAYKVAKVTFVRAGDDRVRVLDVRRLQARPAKSPLGMKPEGLSDPIVMLDQIDDHVRTQLGPVLDGARYTLADDGWGYGGRGRAAEVAAGRAVRRELEVALGHRLDDPDRTQARIEKLVLASVRHHEAQHGLEQERAPAYPEVLAHMIGPLVDVNGYANPLAVRARNELSAYTSQIASDMWLPQVALWNLSRHAFQISRRGTPESFAAVIVLEGLARQLHIPLPGPLMRGNDPDREKIAQLVAPLAATPTIELRSAAARLWAELFGERLVRLVDDKFGE